MINTGKNVGVFLNQIGHGFHILNGGLQIGSTHIGRDFRRQGKIRPVVFIKRGPGQGRKEMELQADIQSVQAPDSIHGFQKNHQRFQREIHK